MTCARPAAAALACAPILARAQAAPGELAGSYLSMLLALAVVVATIAAIAWAARRLGGAPATRGPLKVVASQSVGARERVVVLELGETWLVVGVAPGSITVLDRGPRQALPPAQDPRATFASLLDRARGRRAPLAS